MYSTGFDDVHGQVIVRPKSSTAVQVHVDKAGRGDVVGSTGVAAMASSALKAQDIGPGQLQAQGVGSNVLGNVGQGGLPQLDAETVSLDEIS